MELVGDINRVVLTNHTRSPQIGGALKQWDGGNGELVATGL